MAQSYRSRFLAVQRNNEAAMKTLFTQLANALSAELIRRADGEGNVPRSAIFDVQQAAGDLVRRLFLGRNAKGEFAPFDTVGNGALIPLSPYMRVLWEAIKAAVRIPVAQNAAILANKLPPNIAYTLRTASRNPFVAAKQVSETDRSYRTHKTHKTYLSYLVSEQVFRPNPLAVYDAPHEWVDPNGYRLSDRIWNVATVERRRLDLYLDTAIREGRGALQMSRELEQFLIPGRSLPTTNKPYGTTASADAMRLARTEISQAHQRASVVSAAMNPFVSGMKWNLSASHPKIDICDALARGGKNGDGVYSVESYPGRPHPNCLCFATNVLIGNPDEILEELRADIQAAKQEFVNLVGPLEVERFTQLLLGQGLETEYQGVVTRTIAPPRILSAPRESFKLSPETLDDRLQQIYSDYRTAKAAGDTQRMAALRTEADQIKGQIAGLPVLPATTEPLTGTQPPTPATTTPTRVNDEVSEHLTFNLHETTRGAFDLSLDAIARAHGDGGLGESISVEPLREHLGGAQGAYRPRSERLPGRIRLDRFFGLSDRANDVLIHEIGHYIDDYMDMWDSGLQREWASVVAKTPEYKSLKARAGDNDYVDYLLDRRELWARSYTQYVATRSQDPNLLEWLRREQGHFSYKEHWKDESFEPVAKAIDDIFEKLGWRHGT